MIKIINKLSNFKRHTITKLMNRTVRQIKIDSPTVSFSFDDFPQTAIDHGAEVLSEKGLRGTFYVSFGLLNLDRNVGTITGLDGIERVISQGHELGCHTFSHEDAWCTSPEEYESSILKNTTILRKHFGDRINFTSFAYPKGSVTPKIKTVVQKYFNCSRGINPGLIQTKCDTSLLPSIPLLSNGFSMKYYLNLLDTVVKNKGWIIFFTHDICDEPSDFGCTIETFQTVLKYVVELNFNILPVSESLNKFIALKNMISN